jgi:hypothetical protein
MENRPQIEIEDAMTPEPSTLIKIEYDNKIFLLSIMYDNYNITMNISEENNLSDLIFS